MEKKIKVFVMDVDGTMTDGKIYMGENGEMFKAFNIKDGYGIHEILPEHGVTTVILTGRTSKIVMNRARELEIGHVLQNVKDKGSAIRQLAAELGYDTAEFAYIGDDMIDIGGMKLCGINGCPADAVREVKEVCDFVSSKNGGDGAVRDFIEWLSDEGLI
ncbi:MAG: HAD-IIIA family hydrolase [Lachnospiraceae bacterium]|nr:HAD-IIIA family hydrolase [Lachnospiraceae bacterium]